MRTFLLFAAVFAIPSPSASATRQFGITSFEKVRVDGPFKVRLTTGVAPFARANGSADALDRVAIDVRGDTLVVHNNLDSWSGYPGRDVGPVEVELGTHEISAAWLNGSGALSIDHVRALKFDLSVQGSGLGEIGDSDVDQLNVSIVGTAGARVAGRAGKMTAVIRGVSSLDASALKAADATLGADGSATISADVTDSVTVDARGPATVQLGGHPACTLRVDGSASISGCR